MAKIDKKTGETTYEAIALPPGATPPPGAKPAPKTEIPGSWKLVPTPGAK